eukprot:899095-Pyramimonas_sp.AAC.1
MALPLDRELLLPGGNIMPPRQLSSVPIIGQWDRPPDSHCVCVTTCTVPTTFHPASRASIGRNESDDFQTAVG